MKNITLALFISLGVPFVSVGQKSTPDKKELSCILKIKENHIEIEGVQVTGKKEAIISDVKKLSENQISRLSEAAEIKENPSGSYSVKAKPGYELYVMNASEILSTNRPVLEFDEADALFGKRFTQNKQAQMLFFIPEKVQKSRVEKIQLTRKVKEPGLETWQWTPGANHITFEDIIIISITK
ncbi:MAG: hypothetical protein MH137_08225 [Flavobacteriales bacterium]|nr:hypothetical protein [Flavobacteriales bacterium]